MQQPWYRTTVLWGQTNLTEDDPAHCDLEFFKQYWKDTGVQGLIINCSGIVSYYQSDIKGQYRARTLTTDYYKEWNDAARAAGLKVIARMDIHTTTEDLYREHPEWYCVDRDGAPILAQGRYVACVNGGYFQQFIPDLFRDVIARYRPDGFADNNWSGVSRKTICYCDNCRRLFREYSGSDLPEAADWDDSVYRAWVRWGYETRVRNWDYYNEVTRQASGGCCHWFGMLSADPLDTGDRFYDIKKLASRTPFIFCDQQSRDTNGFFEQNAVNGSLLRLASDENNLVAESMAHYLKGLRTFRLCANTPQETRKWMFCGFSGGISPWYHFIGGNTYDRRKFSISRTVFPWVKENETWLRDRVNCGAVGLIWNQESAIYYGRDEAKNRVRAPFRGFTHALSRAGIPFLPIHADDLERYADRLSAVVLPQVAILTDDQQRAVLRLLDQGKGLVLTGCTATRDADGEPLSETGPLWRRLGLAPEGEMGAAASDESWMVHDSHTYLQLPRQRHPVLAGFEETEILPFGGTVQCVRSTGAMQPVASFIPAFPIYPPEFSWIRQVRQDVGTVWAGTLDSGARVVYFAGDIDRLYGRFLLPDHEKLLVNAVEHVCGGVFPVRVDAPGHVHCDAYRKDGALVVHLVNLCGCDGPVGALEENLPVGPVTVRVQLPGAWSGRARGLWSGREYPIEAEAEGAARVTIDRLDEQEVLVLPAPALP